MWSFLLLTTHVAGSTLDTLYDERETTQRAFDDAQMVRAPEGAQIPNVVDLSQDPRMPPVYNQDKLGSCTANALAGAYQFVHNTKWAPSRLMLYYGERQIDGTTSQDVGSHLEEGIAVMVDCGVVPEQMWPYLEEPASFFTRDPSTAVWRAARHHRVEQAFKVEPTEEAVAWVLSQGQPIVFAMTMYGSCWSEAFKNGGNVTNPVPGEDDIVGGHALLLVGYDADTHRFKFRNSWGEQFGDNGYGTISAEHFFKCLNDNLWIIDPSPEVAAAVI